MDSGKVREYPSDLGKLLAAEYMLRDVGSADGKAYGQVGSYELLDQLATGGSSDVFIAQHATNHELRALKLGKQVEGIDALFGVERHSGDEIRHPNILTALDGGTHDGRPYLIFRLLLGGTLRHAQQQGRFSEPGAIATLMWKLAKATEFVHGRLILHCDLKPENILFEEPNEVDSSSALDEPYLADFGLAQRLATGTGQTPARGGTKGWMSPEQAQGGPLGVSSDVFSLGVLLYWLLSDAKEEQNGPGSDPRLPFGNGPDYRERLATGVAASPCTPRRFGAQLHWDLVAICHRALRQGPASYTSAAELASDLERAREGRPILADDGSPFRRSRKWTRRNRLLSAALAALALVPVEGAVAYDAGVRELAERAHQQNEFSALAQAGAVLGELRGLASQLNRMSEDPELIALAKNGDVTRPSALLEQYRGDFDSVNVFSADGVHRSRAPALTAEPNENCRFKDFFRCAERIGQQLGEAPSELGQGDLPVCVGRAHRSLVDDMLKVGIAAPLLEDGNLVGVVSASTKARDRFHELNMSCGGSVCRSALLGPRDRTSAAAELPHSLSVLAAEGLAEGAELTLEPSTTDTICGADGCAPAAFHALRHGTAPVVTLHDYVDPVTRARGVATIAPVGLTGLRVLISAPEASQTLGQVLVAGGLAVLVAPVLLLAWLLLAWFAPSASQSRWRVAANFVPLSKRTPAPALTKR